MSGITCYDVNDFLKAMADDTRQRILVLLRDREMSVSELGEHLTVHQPTISHHLGILRRAGLVTARREGLWVFCRANSACVAECCDEILARFRETADCESGERMKSLVDLPELGTSSESGGTTHFN